MIYELHGHFVTCNSCVAECCRADELWNRYSDDGSYKGLEFLTGNSSLAAIYVSCSQASFCLDVRRKSKSD